MTDDALFIEVMLVQIQGVTINFAKQKSKTINAREKDQGGFSEILKKDLKKMNRKSLYFMKSSKK